MNLTQTKIIPDRKAEDNLLKSENNNAGLHLRLCVTDRCPNKCLYCVPGGEAGGIGYKKPERELTPIEFVLITKILNLVTPIMHIKITGGEPCERNDICRLIELLISEGFQKTEIVSRSPKLLKLLPTLYEIGLRRLTISVDSLNPQKHKYITGRDTLKELVQSIRKARDLGFILTINSVPLRGINTEYDDIYQLISFAKEAKATLKFIDLMDLKGDSQFLNEYYFPFSLLKKWLKESCEIQTVEMTAGNMGTPMDVFYIDGVKVKVRDSRLGSHFSDRCKDCPNRFCSDGRMALRITPNGSLKTCLLRADKTINLTEVLDTIRDFQAAEFVFKN